MYPSSLWLACTHLQPLSSASVGRYKEHSAVLRASMCARHCCTCSRLSVCVCAHMLVCTVFLYDKVGECWRHLMVPRLWLCFIWCWDGSCWPKEFIHVCIICLMAQNKHRTRDIFYPFDLTWHKQKVSMCVCVWVLSCLIIISGMSINSTDHISEHITQYSLRAACITNYRRTWTDVGWKRVAAKLWTHPFLFASA